MKITFTVPDGFKRGEVVYRVNDPFQYKGTLIGYEVLGDLTRYMVSFPDVPGGVEIYYEGELSTSEDIEYRQQYEPKYD